MARSALPESRIRARRRRRARAVTGMCIAAILIAAIGIIFFLRAPFVRIQHLHVIGAQILSEEELTTFINQQIGGAYFGVIPKNSIFFYPKDSLSENLGTSYPSIKEIELQRTNFSTITIRIAERAPLALWCGESPASSSPCLYMDESGIAYGNALQGSSSLYISYYGSLHGEKLPKQYITRNFFHSLVPLIDALAQKAQLQDPQTVMVDEHNDVRALFPNGFELRFSLDEDGGKIVEDFALALTSVPFTSRELSDFEYLDLRFGEKLYYKLK